MTWNRRSFFAVLFAPIAARFTPKLNAAPETVAINQQIAQSDIGDWSVTIEPGPVLRSQRMEDLDFYNGDQWDEQVRDQRIAAGRPCLVFNRLPGIVAHLAQGKELSPDELMELILETVRKCRDAQVLLNFYRSTQAEVVCLPGPDSIPVALQLGKYADETELELMPMIEPMRKTTQMFVRGDLVRVAAEFPPNMSHFDGRGEMAIVEGSYRDLCGGSGAADEYTLFFMQLDGWPYNRKIAWYPEGLLTMATPRNLKQLDILDFQR